MKRYIYNTILTASFLLSSCSQELREYQFKTDVIDVGTISRHDLTSVTFEVYNKGNIDLEIDKISTDCHCTVAEFPTDVILPSDTAFITISYDGDHIGFFEQTASVYFKEMKYPQLLIIRGEVDIKTAF